MWRVLTGLHVLPVGHTKFAPDWCFGLFKRYYRLCKIGCLDIVQAVNHSAVPNVAQLVSTQDGTTVVPMYDWSSYFEDHTIKTALKGITKMHHFRFSKMDPGKLDASAILVQICNTINIIYTYGNGCSGLY